MASPRARGSQSLEGFITRLTTYENRQSQTQLANFDRADKRFQKNLIKASRAATGGDRNLSRVGKAGGKGVRVDSKGRPGAHLGYRRTRMGRTAVEFAKNGPWQLVDSTINSGPTKEHEISPDNERNPRPLDPATKFKPTLRTVDGVYLHGEGGSATINHPGSRRLRWWGGAVRTAGVEVSEFMARDFVKIGRQVWP